MHKICDRIHERNFFGRPDRSGEKEQAGLRLSGTTKRPLDKGSRDMATAVPQGASSDTGQSSLAPFSHPAFSVLWAATVVSNIGTWMQNAAAGWLMTSLDPDPFTVALVQVAGSLAMFAFALPAGALADIVDRRRLLIFIQIGLAVLVALFGAMVWMERVSATSLLVFSFLAAAGAALIAGALFGLVHITSYPLDTLPVKAAWSSEHGT